MIDAVPELLAFAGVLALGQFSPGPDLILLTQTALRHGRTAGWWATAGITTGLTLHATLALTGLHWLAARGGLPWQILQTAAALYLLWLAVGLWRAGAPGDASASAGEGQGFYFKGLCCNLLNPKVLLFFGAIVTPFLLPPRPAWWPFALGALIVVEGLLLWGLWVALLQHGRIRAGYARAATWINKLFALLMAALAGRLLMTWLEG